MNPFKDVFKDSNCKFTQPQIRTHTFIKQNLHILNDGSATRTSRITGNDSTPDISHGGSNCSAKTYWGLAEPIGSSHNLSILIELNHKIRYQPFVPRTAQWSQSKMNNLPDEPNLSLRASLFKNILINSRQKI